MATNNNLRVYDASEVSVVIGTIVAEGFDDGDFCVVEQDEDSYTLVVGTDGEAARSKTNNRSATITLTLLQTSAANTALGLLHVSDIVSTGGIGIVPLVIRDSNGKAKYIAEKCWIQKPPTRTFGREAQGREWVLRTSSLVAVDGGNE